MGRGCGVARGASSPSSAWSWARGAVVCGGCGAPEKVMRGSPRRGAGAGAALGPAGQGWLLADSGFGGAASGNAAQTQLGTQGADARRSLQAPGGSSPAPCPLGGPFPRVFWQGAVQGGRLWHCLCTHAAVSPARHRHQNAVWGAAGSFGVLWGVLGCCGELWGAAGSCRELWGAAGSCRVLWSAAGCTQHPGAHTSHVPSPFAQNQALAASPQTHRARSARATAQVPFP